MADPVWTALRVLHIGSAIAWIGGATLWGLLIQPTLAQLGPTLPKGAMPTLGRKIINFIPHAGAATLVTGAALFALMAPFYAGVTVWTTMMTAALTLTAIVVVIAYAVLVPLFKKAGAAMAAAQGPPGPEVMGLMARVKKVSLANLALGWLVVLLMVLATAQRTT